MPDAGHQVRAARLLVTGLYGLRDIVLALPQLAALRAENPTATMTMIAPLAARDLVLRLRLVNDVHLLDARSAVAVMLWSWWKRISGAFDRMINGAALDAAVAVEWERLARDMSFMLPPKPYVLFSLPDQLPVLRAAAFVRKLDVMGYHTVLVGISDTSALARLRQAAPQARDLVGRVDLSDMPALAAGAAGVVGGRDGMTALAALSGARTVILTQGEDDALSRLPVDNTVWLQSDDVSYIAVGDMIKAVLP